MAKAGRRKSEKPLKRFAPSSGDADAPPTLRDAAEVQAAHDRLVAIILGDVPNPFTDDPPTLAELQAACDVLCWVLSHHHNEAFGENLKQMDEFLADLGFILRKQEPSQ